MQPAMGRLFVGLNNKDELIGILSMRDLKNCLCDMDCLCELIVAADIMSKNVYSAYGKPHPLNAIHNRKEILHKGWACLISQ